MSSQHPKNILLTGRPGIGKTTIIIRLAERRSGRAVAGFYTEEIRSEQRRLGFRVVTLSGNQATLAHMNLKSRFRVGRYGVDVRTFENVVLAELEKSCNLMLIDEIGRMECFSRRFVAAVRCHLDGVTPVVATVAARGTGFIDEAKARADVEVLEVNHANREHLPQSLAERLTPLS